MRRVALLVVFFLAASAAAALACNDPSLGAVTSTAGPGDPVSFSAVHLDPGATYSITLGGREVASGTADGGTIAGSFTMPDLGASGVYYVELRVAHEDGTWVSSQPIRFAAPAPPPQSAPTVKAPTPEPAPPPKSQTAVPPPPPPVAAPAPARTTEPAARASAPAPRAAARPARAPALPSIAPAVAAARTAPPPAAVVQPAVAPAKAVRRRHAPRHERTQPRPVQPAPVLDYLRREPLIPIDKPHPRAAPLPRPRSGPPFWLLLAVALAAMTAAASAVGAFVRRRAAIRARDLQIEAELQEMIAEARTEDRVGPRSD